MATTAQLENWERICREEDAAHKRDLSSAFDKIGRRYAKVAQRNRACKVPTTLTVGELHALRQFALQFLDD